MTRSIIDPITRIEGHLRVEMEVDNGVVTDAWVSGGCFRGMELVVQDRTPEDAAQISVSAVFARFHTLTLHRSQVKLLMASSSRTRLVSSVTW